MSSHSFPVDSDLTGDDWQQIEDLLDELGVRARSGLPAGDFYRHLLERLAPALGASGGAVWTRGAGDGLRLESQFKLGLGAATSSRDLLARHQAAVCQVLESGQPRFTSLATDPTSSDGPLTVALHPFVQGDRLTGVIELAWSHELPAAGRRAYVRVLEAVAELTADFHRQSELAELRSAADRWLHYDQFAQRVHRTLEVEATAHAIANEARRVIECDRVSVLAARGRRVRVAAISGVDVVERRSKVVHALERLSSRAASCGEPIWYHDGIADLPDEIAGPLDAYLEESHARVLALVPLLEPLDESNTSTPRVIGILVAEHFQALPAAEPLRQRVAAVSGHAALALHNAELHSRMPLARAGRLLGKVRWLAEARQLPKTVLALSLLAAAAAALVLVPADFEVEARGELQPLERRDVFASDDGVVSELLVESNGAVQAGQPLLVLRKSELELEIRRILGEMQTAEKKLASLRAERLQDDPADGARRRDPHELAADEEELKATLTGLAGQQAILDDQQRNLTIRSPIDGQAITWNLEQLLAARPVQRGQALLSVANLEGPWMLELHVADDRAGHVLAAREAITPDLEVDFVLPSDPGRTYRGRVIEVAPSTEIDAKQESSVLVTVAFDKSSVPALRPGATAAARIHCGRRSLGYVWLHDLYDYVQSLWW